MSNECGRVLHSVSVRRPCGPAALAIEPPSSSESSLGYSLTPCHPCMACLRPAPPINAMAVHRPSLSTVPPFLPHDSQKPRVGSGQDERPTLLSSRLRNNTGPPPAHREATPEIRRAIRHLSAKISDKPATGDTNKPIGASPPLRGGGGGARQASTWAAEAAAAMRARELGA